MFFITPSDVSNNLTNHVLQLMISGLNLPLFTFTSHSQYPLKYGAIKGVCREHGVLSTFGDNDNIL